MSVERSQNEGERYGISEPHEYREGGMPYYEKLKLGSFCHIDDRSGPCSLGRATCPVRSPHWAAARRRRPSCHCRR